MATAADVFAYVGNIPADFHSCDIRNYFSMFIEDGGFSCFHFRHRPEIQTPTDSLKLTDEINGRKESQQERQQHVQQFSRLTQLTQENQQQGHGHEHSVVGSKKAKNTRCCVVKVLASRLNNFIRMYHRKHWLDNQGNTLSSTCLITGIKVNTENGSHDPMRHADNQYKTRKEMKMIPPDRETFTDSDLEKLVELHPPPEMPNGNVGTPTSVFLQFIKECKLPPNIIGKLGLKFPRKRPNKIYTNMHFDYGTENVASDAFGEEETITTASGHELTIQEEKTEALKPSGDGVEKDRNLNPRPGTSRMESKRRKHRRKPCPRDSDSDGDSPVNPDSEGDSDDCEDWERHEALHSDVAHHVERNKERLFESEIELKWEKGGSGLVFYTDAQFWDAEKGDFDERTTDDWDVDMSIYTDPTAGDKDARDFMLMREEKRRRRGVQDPSVFDNGIGQFEKYTKGFGRRVLEKQGWKEGEGLGPSVSGISEALENDGQKPYDKKGIGYAGEKLVRRSKCGATKRRLQDQGFIISTIYDNPAESDPPEQLYRSNDHHHLTYRKSFIQGETVGGDAEKKS